MWVPGLFQTLWRWGKFRNEPYNNAGHPRTVCRPGAPGKPREPWAWREPSPGKERRDGRRDWSEQTRWDMSTDGLRGREAAWLPQRQSWGAGRGVAIFAQLRCPMDSGSLGLKGRRVGA